MVQTRALFWLKKEVSMVQIRALFWLKKEVSMVQTRALLWFKLELSFRGLSLFVVVSITLHCDVAHNQSLVC